MKRGFILLLLLLISCQEELYYGEDSSISYIDDYPTKSEDFMIEEPVVFLSETDFNKWSHISKLEDRFKACAITENQLKLMTTDALVKSILHYPLNFLYYLYDDPSRAIDIIMEHSALHQEFVYRQDAAKAIMDSFEETTISFEDITVSKDYTTLSYIDEMFLEYFLASEYVKGFSDVELKDRLKKIVETKMDERLDDKHYCFDSLIPLIRICEKEGFKIKNKNIYKMQQLNRNGVIYTCFGHIIYVDYNIEFDQDCITRYTNCTAREFPDATVVSPASNLYNCHSYAWYDNSTSNNIWIKETFNEANQLFHFWTEDLYVSCTESEAEKVNYYLGDHSAIVIDSSHYISKWGNGPVMIHDPECGPYSNMSQRHYYHVRPDLPLHDIQISGDTIVDIGEANNYIGSYFVNRPLSYVWSVRYWGGSNSPYTMQQLTPDEYQLSCFDYGIYTISIDSYYKGINVNHGELNVNCAPQLLTRTHSE